MPLIYLDNNATTRTAPEVLEAMLPFYAERYGNPASLHPFGAELADEIDAARRHVAALVGGRPEEICFTSGGSESDNLAIRGILDRPGAGRHVMTSPVEHPAVREVLREYRRNGWEVQELRVDEDGRVNPDSVRRALRPETALIAVMAANNETGALLPVTEIARIAAEARVPLFTDAIQVWGRVPLNLSELPGVSLASISAHKFHGPKGMGALFVRRGTRLRAQIVGGGQEGRRRAGTANVPGIVGMGRAAQLARERLPHVGAQLELRDRLQRGILELFPEALVNAGGAERLPNTLNVCLPKVDADMLLFRLGEEGICASSGSACTAGSTEPSHVLLAMGRTARQAQGAIRFSLSHETTREEIERVLELLPRAMGKG